MYDHEVTPGRGYHQFGGVRGQLGAHETVGVEHGFVTGVVITVAVKGR